MHRTLLPAVKLAFMRLCGRGGVLRELSLDVIALLWPAACVGCGRRDRELCDDCERTVRGGDPAAVQHVDGVGVPCYAAAAYAGPVRAVLLAYKHAGAFGFSRVLGRRLKQPLARALAEAAAAGSGPGIDPGPAPLLVSLPSRPQRVRERGWKHVDEVVSVAVRVGRLPGIQCAALRALRGRTGQVGLDAVRRELNARRIAVRTRALRTLRGRDVILIDDIVTTGATMRAAVAVVEAAGGRVAAAVTLCAAARRDSPQKTEWNLTGEKG